MMNKMHLRLMGVRGSVPVHTAETAVYGGATSCILVKAGNETFILDAGSGLCANTFAAFSDPSHFTVLLSHAHVDHLLGFPMFPPFFRPDVSADIYLRTRNGLDAKSQIEALISPPLWPIRTDQFGASLRFHDVLPHFSVGDVIIETLEIRHPGGCTAYKLQYDGVSIVYASDFEASEEESAFVAFAQNCSLLLMDAQYTADESVRTRGFGHTHMQRSISLARECRAQNTIFIHHDPQRNDATLRAFDTALQAQHPNMHYGYVGEEVFL